MTPRKARLQSERTAGPVGVPSEGIAAGASNMVRSVHACFLKCLFCLSYHHHRRAAFAFGNREACTDMDTSATHFKRDVEDVRAQSLRRWG